MRIVALLVSLCFIFQIALAADNYEKYIDRSDRAEHWVFKELPKHLERDLVESFLTPATVWALAGGIVTTAALSSADSQVQSGLQPGNSLGTGNKILTVVAHPLLLGGVSLAGLGISELADAKKPALTFGTMLEALAISQTITLSAKLISQRQRPDGSDNLSFPSAHTSAAFTLAAVTESFYGPAWGVPSFAVASLVGFSRLDANQHFLSDVVAGALLGTLVGLGAAHFHKKEFPQLFVTPTVGQNSSGLSFSWLF